VYILPAWHHPDVVHFPLQIFSWKAFTFYIYLIYLTKWMSIGLSITHFYLHMIYFLLFFHQHSHSCSSIKYVHGSEMTWLFHFVVCLIMFCKIDMKSQAKKKKTKLFSIPTMSFLRNVCLRLSTSNPYSKHIRNLILIIRDERQFNSI